MLDLHDQILKSEALQIHFFLRVLNTNHYVVYRNCQELINFLAVTENPDSSNALWAIGNRDALHNAMNEVTRLLLNYLTSSAARVENTRNLMRKRYRDQPFFKLYQGRVTLAFKGEPLNEFIEGLRNYSVHYSLPFASARSEFNRETGLVRSFTLDRDNLLSSGFKWNAKGKAYLKNCNENISIRETVLTHYGRIHNFQAWLEREIHELHKVELDWLYSTEAQYRVAFEEFRKKWDIS